MIDLEQTHLPTCLVVNGNEVPIHTSFRAWLRFTRIANEYGIADPSVLDISGENPPDGWIDSAMEFASSLCPTPREEPTIDKVFDWLADSDYIVGAFQQTYGIDLTEDDMHWHRFLALYRSLPSSTKLNQIIGYRTWDKKDMNKKPDEIHAKLKKAWQLPRDEREINELLDLQEELLGGEW